jgi:hypothetical protein
MKYNNSVAVSSGGGSNRCITIIDVVSQEVMTTISMDTNIYGMAVTILPSGRKEHPLTLLPFLYNFSFRLSCIFSTDIGGDRSATIIWKKS